MKWWVWLMFFGAVILTAFFMRPAHAHDLPCFDKSQAELLQPRDTLRGYGAIEEGIIKLSVTVSGAFLITFSPPKHDAMVCLVWMGEGWQFVRPTGEEAKYER
jgi:hypothetical protein